MGDDLDLNDLWLKGDPDDHPLWKQAELMADAPPRPAKGYLTCSLAWLARVLPVVRTADQLAVLQLIYRKCLLARRRTVALSNRDLQPFGISRYTKYRILAALVNAQVLSIKTRNGRSTEVTLHRFP
jgi:hypothetical protein